MNTSEKQQRFSEVFASQQGFTMRRAFVSTRYALAKNEYAGTEDYEQLEKYRSELASIDGQAILRYHELRQQQTRYQIEYETEQRDATTGRLMDMVYSEQLYLFNNCDIDTYSNGWDMEDPATQDVLYEVAEFLLQYKAENYLVKNIKRL